MEQHEQVVAELVIKNELAKQKPQNEPDGNDWPMLFCEFEFTAELDDGNSGRAKGNAGGGGTESQHHKGIATAADSEREAAVEASQAALEQCLTTNCWRPLQWEAALSTEISACYQQNWQTMRQATADASARIGRTLGRVRP